MVNFIKESFKKDLQEKEKDNTIQFFYLYLLDKDIPIEYSEYISAFIIKKSKDTEFTKKIQSIKEGVILYSGLKYNSSLSELGSWTTELNIYLDTEILFSLAGYNGELFSFLFNDFYNLVDEINENSRRKGKKEMIHLKYFQETKDEIESYFTKAEYIIRGQGVADPSKTAMNVILNNCKDPSDISLKKNDFFNLLEKNRIHLIENINFYEEGKNIYNIEDIALVRDIQEKLKENKDKFFIDEERINEEYIKKQLRYLNYVNILRKGANEINFENVGHILLSANKVINFATWSEKIKKNGDIPLSTTLGFMTDKFWFKLSKGFGIKEHPKTFDLTTKAQIILSTQINDSVGEKYKQTKKDFLSKTITEEQVKLAIVRLRQEAKKPEEIKDDCLEDILEALKQSDVEILYQQEELFRNKFEKVEKEIKEKNRIITEKDEEKKALQSELIPYKIKEEQRKKAKEKITKFIKRFLLIFCPIILFIVFKFLISSFPDIVQLITYITLGMAILTFFGIKRKEIINIWNN